MRIEYCGTKQHGRADTVSGTGLVWARPGDVQDVPDDKAAALLAHPTVWRLAVTAAPVQAADEPPQAPSAEDMEAMSLERLRELAADHGIRVDGRIKDKAKVIALICGQE